MKLERMYELSRDIFFNVTNKNYGTAKAKLGYLLAYDYNPERRAFVHTLMRNLGDRDYKDAIITVTEMMNLYYYDLKQEQAA